jgi:hypothetical protein
LAQLKQQAEKRKGLVRSGMDEWRPRSQRLRRVGQSKKTEEVKKRRGEQEGVKQPCCQVDQLVRHVVEVGGRELC